MVAGPEGSKQRQRVRYQRAEVREQLILNAAREVLLKQGWDYFGIDRIAEYLECSRSLIYAHFPSKEEILLALSIESTRLRLRLSEKALEFKGRPRERMLAYGEVEALLYERHTPVQLIVTAAHSRSKTTPERQRESNRLVTISISMGAKIIREAIEAKDLTLPKKMSPEEFYYAIWALNWGSISLIQSDYSLAEAGIKNPRRTTHKSMGLMLDGYGWRPLTSEFNYRTTWERVYKEVFTPEVIKSLMTI